MPCSRADIPIFRDTLDGYKLARIVLVGNSMGGVIRVHVAESLKTDVDAFLNLEVTSGMKIAHSANWRFAWGKNTLNNEDTMKDK
jgi:hypothetical protein